MCRFYHTSITTSDLSASSTLTSAPLWHWSACIGSLLTNLLIATARRTRTFWQGGGTRIDHVRGLAGNLAGGRQDGA